MARAAAFCVLNSLRASRTSKAQRNLRTVSGSASLDSTPRRRSRTLSTVKSRTPSGLARSTCASLSSSPSGRNATSISAGGISTVLPTSRVRAITSRLRLPATPSATSGTGSSVRPPSAATGRQQATLGVTPEPLQEFLRLRLVTNLERRDEIEQSRGNPSPPLRSPTAPLSRADRARQATPTDRVPRRDDARIKKR